MHTQRGNFLLQALLALTLVFVFIPFFAKRLALSDISSQMYATTRQVDVAKTASRIYIQENADSLPYNKVVLSGDKFSDVLEPYGLPLGFIARTALGQDISLIINKDSEEITAFLRLSGGNLNTIQRAELARRIGFYAVYNVNEPDGDIDVGIQLGDTYSDVVKRNEKNSDFVGFLTDLDMGGFRFDNAANILGMRAAFDTGEITTLSITGNEVGRKERNNIKAINANKVVFQTGSGESALSLTRGTLKADALVARTISKFGETGNLIAVDAAFDNFDMTTGRTGFTGPDKWNIGGNVVTSRITFSLERLEVSSFVNATRGQDVFIDADTLSYSTASGIETNNIYSSHITLRDQTSDSLSRGGSGAVILDIRPAGASVLPDALVDTINNESFSILANPTTDNDNTIKCESIISDLGSTYNQKSLAQYIICQYVFWQRLEHRISVKQCLMEGGNDCK
ncbi:MAG: hypothetical protein J5742_02740 [Alphaproteobacteria bacterium]|nr:hypothetical protein [Alphaproteobacteria bacterium]